MDDRKDQTVTIESLTITEFKVVTPKVLTLDDLIYCLEQHPADSKFLDLTLTRED